MTCDEAMDRMLEADPGALEAALAGTDAPETAELGGHLRSCDRCRAVARTLRSELETLDGALDGLGHRATTDAAADAVADAVLDAVRAERGDRASWARRAWVPLAAAAALAGLLMVGRQPPPLPPSNATAQSETIDPRVSVSPPADRGAAILQTENPNITIVWLYEREDS